MKVTRYGRSLPHDGLSLGGDPTVPPGSDPAPDCCDPVTDADMPDRAEDAPAVSLSSGSGTPAFVQGVAEAEPSSYLTDITLAAPPTLGNVLILVMHDRTMVPADMNVPAGFQTLVSNNFAGVPAYSQLIAWKISDGTETTITFDNASPTTGGAPETAAVLEFSGAAGLALDTSATSDDTDDATPEVPSITPTAVDAILIAASVKQPANPNPGPRTLTGYTLGADSGYAAVGNRHRMEVFYKIVTPASGSYSGTLSDSGDGTDDSNIIHAALTLTDPAWNVPQPNTVDASDSTYGTVTGTDLLRVDLGAEYRIVRTRIRIGANNSGARTFTIKGANLPDFSDEVTLTTIAFTATGSYTAQDVTGTWVTTEEYRYYELSIGTSDTYRIHAWELYEETPTTVGQHVADTSDAHDASAISIADAGAYFTATDVEAALQELAAGSSGSYVTTTEGGGEVVSTVAASGATETLDLTDGNVHDVTLTADCTFTFASVTSGRARSFTLLLRQDGTGGWTTTWPGSVVWAGGSAPTLVTTASTVSVLTFFTIDGGTVWYGFSTGTTTDWAEAGDLAAVGETASAGSSSEIPRADHVHTIDPDAVMNAGRWAPVMDGSGNVVTDGGTGAALMSFIT